MDFKDELQKETEKNKLVKKLFKEQFPYKIAQNIELCTDSFIELLKKEAIKMVRTGKYEVLSEYTILENYKMVVDPPIRIEWEKRNLEGYAQNNVVYHSTDIESGLDFIKITIADNGEIYRRFLSTLSKKAHKEGFSMVIANENDSESRCFVHLQFSISWSKK